MRLHSRATNYATFISYDWERDSWVSNSLVSGPNGSTALLKKPFSDKIAAHWVEWLWNRRVEYSTIHSSIRSFVRTPHSFAKLRTARTARGLRTRSFVRSLTHSLTRELMGKRFMLMNWMRRFHAVSTHCALKSIYEEIDDKLRTTPPKRRNRQGANPPLFNNSPIN